MDAFDRFIRRQQRRIGRQFEITADRSTQRPGMNLEGDLDGLIARAYTRYETVGLAYRKRKDDCIGIQVRGSQR